jgi:pyruvate/2-oxoglutarate dehydrogenase complex dihydrolipoamide acyltransferase (E2) component
MTKENYELRNFPAQRRFALDAGRLGRKKHIVHGLAEVDVTKARELIGEHRQRSGEKLSFTAFIINCLGEGIRRHPELHAYRDWRGRLVIFEDINIVTMIEVQSAGRLIPMPRLLKAVNRKSYRELHAEIRAIQAHPGSSEEARFMHWFLYLPWPFRRLFYWFVTRLPHLLRDHSSSVLVTAVGMFSRGAGWGITMPSHTLSLVLGGIALKPGIIKGRIEPREYLHITLSVDHDVVDGAPIARFSNDLMSLIEEGYGLPLPEG